ncbi:MAG: hypothetical protein WBC02_04130 [Candidatus Aminicenantaceae bacterium]
MKIFGPILWKDPIGWAQRAAGIKFNFWLFTFCNVLAGALTVYLFIIGDLSLVFVLMLVVVFIILGPFYYLYALRKLVLELKKREKTPEGTAEKEVFIPPLSD